MAPPPPHKKIFIFKCFEMPFSALSRLFSPQNYQTIKGNYNVLLGGGIKVLICLAILRSCVHEALVERIKTTAFTFVANYYNRAKQQFSLYLQMVASYYSFQRMGSISRDIL